jgi:GT2 family glycosyltransferase
MIDIYVVILNWNGAEDTIECLDSLLSQKGVNLGYIVIDNCSWDDSIQKIQARFPNITIIKTERNLGYPGGMNVGIRLALEKGAKKIFIVNNDTIAQPGMMSSLLAQLKGDIAVVAPAIFYADQPEQLWSLGGKINPVLLELIKPHSKDNRLPKVPEERDFFTGCAMLLRSDIFEKIGFFDEKFFPGYYEDLDFCLRIKRQQYKMLLVPQAHLLHKISRASGGKHSPRVYYLMARNSGYYFRKHMRLWQAPFILTFRLISAIKTSLLLIFTKRKMSLLSYWGGLIRGWSGKFPGFDNRYVSYYTGRANSPEGLKLP